MKCQSLESQNKCWTSATFFVKPLQLSMCGAFRFRMHRRVITKKVPTQESLDFVVFLSVLTLISDGQSEATQWGTHRMTNKMALH